MTDGLSNIYGDVIYTETSQASFPSSASTLVLPELSEGAEVMTDVNVTNIRQLPIHQNTPFGAKTFDFIRLIEVPAFTFVPILLMSYQVGPSSGMSLNMMKYGTFSNAQFTTEAWFLIFRNGARILEYHGDPMDNMKISLGCGNDLSEACLKEAVEIFRPGDTLEVYVLNFAAVATEMGARFRGWIDTSNIMSSY